MEPSEKFARERIVEVGPKAEFFVFVDGEYLGTLLSEHFGFGVRLSGEPTLVEDNVAMLKMLEDVIKKNAAVSEELLLIRARFKAAASRK